MAESDFAFEDRKPARRMSEIPIDVLVRLTQGSLATKNLVEWLAVDRLELLQSVHQSLDLPIDSATLRTLAKDLVGVSALKRSFAIGELLATVVRPGDDVWKKLSCHPSDIVREWAAILIGRCDLTFPRKLAWIKLFADDDNAGLREVAWMALRADVAARPEECIRALGPWTGSRNERLRRYASEITRPCGVWTAHISRFKEHPDLGLELLEPLRADDSKYVRDSVGNWLNDASKTARDWVLQVTQRWSLESPCKETAAIVHRALRTIRKT